MLDITPRSGLSEEQRLMRQSCRDFVDEVVTPFIRSNWQREWDMNPQARLPPEILQGAEQIGIRTLGVPEEFGGVELEPKSEVRTFALISEEIARGDSGLADKLVQNWKVSVLLRNLAPRHLQEKWFKRLVEDPQFLLAHCLSEPRGASDRWLPCNETMGCRFMNNGELVFEDLRVPADHLLVENDALGKAGIYFRPGKIIQASKNLGVGVRAMELHGGNGVMLDFGVEKIFRDAAIFLHMDATADISKMKIVKSMFPATAGK